MTCVNSFVRVTLVDSFVCVELSYLCELLSQVIEKCGLVT